MPQAAIDKLRAALKTNADDVDYVQLLAEAADISTSMLESHYALLFNKLTTLSHEPGKERVHEIAETLGYYISDESVESTTPAFETWQSAVSQVLFDRIDAYDELESLGPEGKNRFLQDGQAFLLVQPDHEVSQRLKTVIDELAEIDLKDIEQLYKEYQNRPDKSNLEAGAALIQKLIDKGTEFQKRYPTASQESENLRGWIEEVVIEQQDIAINSIASQTELLPKEIHSVWVGGSLTGNKANILGQWAVANPDYNVNLWYDSDALLANLLREAINEEIDKVLSSLSADDPGYKKQRTRSAKPVYDYLAEWLRDNPGDEGRSKYLTEYYGDFLLKKFGLGSSTTKEQLTLAIEKYRTKSLRELQGTASRIGVQLRDIRTELLPNFQNAAFYEETLGLYGGHLGSASDIARVGILAKEGGLYTDVDIAPEKPLGDIYLSPQLAQFLPVQGLVDGQVVDQGLTISRKKGTYTTIHLGVLVSHKNSTLINLLREQQTLQYETLLQNIENIHNYGSRHLAAQYSSLQPIYNAVNELGQKVVGAKYVQIIKLFHALKAPTEYYNQFTEEGAISEWEVGPARLLRQKLDQQLGYLNEWQKPLQELQEKDTSGLTEEELAAHKTRLQEAQETLASHYKEAAWKAFLQVTSLDPTTRHIASEDEERAILAELDERFKDVSPEYLPYETRRAVLEAYNRGILPIPYGVEAIPPSLGENLPGRFEQEVAIHLAALDLYETGGGKQNYALARLRESLEQELSSTSPVDHQRLLSLVRQIETHMGSNQKLVSLVKELKQSGFSEGLRSYLLYSETAGELVYEETAYDEVMVVVGRAGLSRGSELEDRLASALEATLEAKENNVTAQDFLQQEATKDSSGYSFFYSEAGLYSLLQSNLPEDVSLGSASDLVQGLQALTNQDVNIPIVLDPVFTAISQNLVEPDIWGRVVNRSLTTLEPFARLKLASALGLGHLQLAMEVVSERETVLTEEFLDKVAVHKLLEPDILQEELERGNQEEVEEVLKRVSTEVLQAYGKQFGQNAYNASYEQETQDTLVRVFELATDSQKVILARSLSEQYDITQNDFLQPVLERIQAEKILQEQAQIQEDEQNINDYWKAFKTFVQKHLVAPAEAEDVVDQLELQQLQDGPGLEKEGLIGYQRAETGKGKAVYSLPDSELEILIDLEAAGNLDTFHELLDQATEAVRKNSQLPATDFLHQTGEVTGYSYRYSPEGVFNLVQEHLGEDFTEKSTAQESLVAAVEYLAVKKTPLELRTALQPLFDYVKAGFIPSELWSSTLNRVGHSLSPEGKISFASGLGLDNLANLRLAEPTAPLFKEVFTDNLLNQVAAYKLLDTDTFSQELSAGNSQEVARILEGAVGELRSTRLTGRIDSIVTEVSQKPEALETLATGIAQVLGNDNIAITSRSHLYSALGEDNLATLGASQPELTTAITEFLSDSGALPEVYSTLVEGLPDFLQQRAGVKEDFVEALRYLQQDPNRDLSGALGRTFTYIEENGRIGLDNFVEGIVEVHKSLGTTGQGSLRQGQFVEAVGLDNLQELVDNGAVSSEVAESIAALEQGLLGGNIYYSTLVQQLINGEITTEDFVAAYKDSTSEDQPQLLSQLLEAIGQSSNIPFHKIPETLIKSVLTNYGSNKLSPAADNVVETLLEQLRLDPVLKPRIDSNVQINSEFLRKVTLKQAVEPQVTRVTISPDGNRVRENLGVDYNHEFIEVRLDEELSKSKRDQLNQIHSTLSEWSDQPGSSDIIRSLKKQILDLLEGNLEKNTVIITTRGPDGKLAAAGTSTYINESAHLEFNAANPDSQLPLKNRPEGTLLRAGTANRIASLRYLAEQLPHLKYVTSYPIHERAIQGLSDFYFFSDNVNLKDWLFLQLREGYTAAQESLLQRNLPYLERAVQGLERAANSASRNSYLLDQINQLQERIAELKDNPNGQLTHETLEQLRTDIGSKIGEFWKQSSEDIRAKLGYEASLFVVNTRHLRQLGVNKLRVDLDALQSATEQLLKITKEIIPFVDTQSSQLKLDSVEELLEDTEVAVDKLKKGIGDQATQNTELEQLTKRFSGYAAEALEVYVDVFGELPDWQGTLTENLEQALPDLSEFLPSSGALPQVYNVLVEGLPDFLQQQAGVKEDFVEALRYLQQDPNRDLSGALDRTFKYITEQNPSDLPADPRLTVDSLVRAIVEVYNGTETPLRQREFAQAVGISNLENLKTIGAIESEVVAASIEIIRRGLKGGASSLNIVPLAGDPYEVIDSTPEKIVLSVLSPDGKAIPGIQVVLDRLSYEAALTNGEITSQEVLQHIGQVTTHLESVWSPVNNSLTYLLGHHLSQNTSENAVEIILRPDRDFADSTASYLPASGETEPKVTIVLGTNFLSTPERVTASLDQFLAFATNRLSNPDDPSLTRVAGLNLTQDNVELVAVPFDRAGLRETLEDISDVVETWNEVGLPSTNENNNNLQEIENIVDALELPEDSTVRTSLEELLAQLDALPSTDELKSLETEADDLINELDALPDTPTGEQFDGFTVSLKELEERFAKLRGLEESIEAANGIKEEFANNLDNIQTEISIEDQILEQRLLELQLPEVPGQTAGDQIQDALEARLLKLKLPEVPGGAGETSSERSSSSQDLKRRLAALRGDTNTLVESGLSSEGGTKPSKSKENPVVSVVKNHNSYNDLISEAYQQSVAEFLEKAKEVAGLDIETDISPETTNREIEQRRLDTVRLLEEYLTENSSSLTEIKTRRVSEVINQGNLGGLDYEFFDINPEGVASENPQLGRLSEARFAELTRNGVVELLESLQKIDGLGLSFENIKNLSALELQNELERSLARLRDSNIEDTDVLNRRQLTTTAEKILADFKRSKVLQKRIQTEQDLRNNSDSQLQELEKRLAALKEANPEVEEAISIEHLENLLTPVLAAKALNDDLSALEAEVNQKVQAETEATGVEHTLEHSSIKVSEEGHVTFSSVNTKTGQKVNHEVRTDSSGSKLEKFFRRANDKIDSLDRKISQLRGTTGQEHPSVAQQRVGHFTAVGGLIIGGAILAQSIRQLEEGNDSAQAKVGVALGSYFTAHAAYGITKQYLVPVIARKFGSQIERLGAATERLAIKSIARVSGAAEKTVTQGLKLAGKSLGKTFGAAIPLIGIGVGIYALTEDSIALDNALKEGNAVAIAQSTIDTISDVITLGLDAIGLIAPIAEVVTAPLGLIINAIRFVLDDAFGFIAQELAALPEDASDGEKAVAVLKGLGEGVADVLKNITIWGAIIDSIELDKKHDRQQQQLLQLRDPDSYFSEEEINGEPAINFNGGESSYNGGKITFTLSEDGLSGRAIRSR